MLILASLSGIQSYLFDVRESGGGQARSLRNRSFRIQLIAECAALRLLEAARLPHDRLVFNAAGKVCIDADGATPDALRAVHEAAANVERQLLRETHGRLRFSLALESLPGRFVEQFERANRALVKDKMRPFMRAACGGESWADGALVVRELWSADEEADRDVAVGCELLRAQWLTIWRADDSNGRDVCDVIGSAGRTILGFRVGLDANEPTRPDRLVSCSNLGDPHVAPRSVDRRLFHPRRLARHIPRDVRGNAIEFVDLAKQARGAPMLAVLKADADSLGAAILGLLRESAGDGASALLESSRTLDRFFADTLESEKARHASPWSSIYTVFSGGDDLLAVGPWNIVLDFAAHARELFDERFGPCAVQSHFRTPLTISAGVAVIKSRYPIHLAAKQAEELLVLAKGQPAPGASAPKDQCAALGEVWKWEHHDAIIGAGKQLADWVETGVVQRGWLHTLLQLALLRRGQAGPEDSSTQPVVATSRLAYHVSRNWPKPRRRDDAKPPARQWIDAVLDQFDDDPASAGAIVRFLPAVLRYALLATRSATQENER